MNDLFSELMERHRTLVEAAESSEEPVVLTQAEKLLGDIRRAGRCAIDPQHRMILAAVARDLGRRIFALSKLYPPVRLEEPAFQRTPRQDWLETVRLDPDPFLYTDGGNDPNLLKYFYRVPGYFSIRGDPSRLETVFVFGADGSGKSSLRNAIAQDCRAEGILPVTWEDFAPLTRRLKEVGTIPPGDYARQVLGVGIAALTDEVSRGLVSLPPHNDLTQVARDGLWSYVLEYESEPVRKLTLQAFLRPSGVQELPTDTRELLGNFCRYITMLFGYASVYFLVDPMGDGDLSPDVDIAWQVLRHLLSEQRLLDLTQYRGTFKFFLNSVFLPKTVEIPWIAREQIRIVYRPLQWSGDALRALLRERLRQCSLKEPPYVSLGQLSEVDHLDDMVIEASSGTPRDLIAICNMLFSAHCERPVTPNRLLITWDEVENVLAQLPQANARPGVGYLIEQGESERVEFRETMRWNVETGRADSELEKTLAKALCAFMNGDGGTLVIGVDDTGNAFGLAEDISALDKTDEDGFELALADVVATYLEIPYRAHLEVTFHDYQGKRVCVIQVQRSREPVFCRFEQGHEFYVRRGLSSLRLSTKEAVEYVQRHFGMRSLAPVSDRTPYAHRVSSHGL